ncbi:MAG: tRNA(Ile)-lysidine synthase [Cocleimonas sp.]
MVSLSLELIPSAIHKKLNSKLSQYLFNQLDKQSESLHSDIIPIKRILVAYSGGLDSHVLLHVLSCISKDQLDLRAVYINHGLQEQALQWSHHCHEVCKELKIPFKSVSLDLTIPKGESLEELARNARYEVLYGELEKNEILVTAHHQNDQAETLLLQLFRGAGVSGLAAMSNVNKVDVKGDSYFHLRPLLSQSRQTLENYAKEFDLTHIEDPSNKDTMFDRNFLRQEVMPLLRQRWLGIDKAISRTASLQAETKSLLDEFAQQELPNILTSESNHFVFDKNQSMLLSPIVIPELLKHSEAKQRLLLRYWISQQGFDTPSAKKLQHVFSDVIESTNDKQPLLKWRGVELRRFQQHLYITPPLSDHDVTQVITWRTDNELYIPSLNITLDPHLLNLASHKNITVRFRQGGESIEISKRGNISLKNLFQELQVPPWVRPRLPLIYEDEKLLKIVGLDEFKRHPHTL